ncbi:flagellar export protein FliJ [Clostridium bovifaecis]|uniref:Flagellar FliJ protein n=1 Tax=Clostridium bovifaecis TaxID=2184719 RepID=A0A6I6FBC6_9CLOT|nr:flagellar export protein FliJ [Clostridium bovifaecis]
MSGFNFRLQKILDIRYEKEEESKRDFKAAQDAKDSVQKRLKKLEESYNKYSKIDLSSSVVERRIKQNYCNVIQFNINETSAELEKKTEILETKRETLKSRQVERKTVEILRDNQEKAYIKEQNLIEQKANDEFALYGYIRNLKYK